jgi:predicted transcriptional regulator
MTSSLFEDSNTEVLVAKVTAEKVKQVTISSCYEAQSIAQKI